MRNRAYLDWNATAPVSAAVRDGMAEALGVLGNPSSVHAEGRTARALIETARARVAALVGADTDDVIFTSGGTEANHLALSPSLAGANDAELFVSAVEHPSVLSGGQFAPARVSFAPVTQDGVLDLDRLADVLGSHQVSGNGHFMLSVLAANNETGAIQPVAEAARMAHEAGGVMHCDAVQIAGKLPVSVEALGADSFALAAHKIGGPKGVGALIVRNLARKPVFAVLNGGGQERRWRAGTENVAGIVGFGIAAEASLAALGERAAIEAIRDRLECAIAERSPEAVFFAQTGPRLPNTSCFAVAGMAAETIVMALDLDGFAVSSGAACASGKVKASHVLSAMGISPELAQCAIRVSIGRTTAGGEIDAFLSAWTALYSRFKERRAAA